MCISHLIKSLILINFVVLPGLTYAQQTIPESVASGATNLVRTVPSGKAPSITDLVKDIDIVVRGVVGTSRSYLSDDQRSVLTDYEIQNPTILFRASTAATVRPGIPTPVAVTLVGGTIKIGSVEFTQYEEGLPILEPGAEHLFLLKQVDNHYYPVGLFLGAFGIVDGKLQPLTRVQGFAPEYRGVPAADAAADVLAKIRARR